MTDFSYDAWPSGEPYDYGNAGRGHTIWDAIDYHVDLGCGKLKKGRIGIDFYPSPGVNIVMDLDALAVYSIAGAPGGDAATPLVDANTGMKTISGMPWPARRALCWGLPFEDDSIDSIISHHALEHIGGGFLRLVDEVYRVLKPAGIFRPITPLFPSQNAVQDATHKRYFMEGTWDAFCGHLGDENNPTGCWQDSFAVPYTKARFEMLHKDITPRVPAEQHWGPDDVREIRVALRAIKKGDAG